MRVGRGRLAGQPERGSSWIARLGGLFALGGSGDGSGDGRGDRPIEELILGGRRRYTWAEILAETGMEPRLASRLWRSMGFAEIDVDEVAFTDADRDAMCRAARLLESGLVPADVEIAATRTLGQAMGTLADWQIEVLHQMVLSADGEVDDARIHDVADELLPLLETMQTYIWRRHLAAAAGRFMTASPETGLSRTLVVGFADMVEFTRTTRSVSPSELLELVERFQAVAADLVATHGGRVVKTVGDEVLYVAEEPAAAAEIALGLLDAVAGNETLPELRIGMALGAVLTRYGDVFGEVVNIASRLTTHARPGRILIDAHLAGALEHHDAYRVKNRRSLSVQGYSRLSSWGLSRNR